VIDQDAEDQAAFDRGFMAEHRRMTGAELEVWIDEQSEQHPCSGGRCPDPEAHAEGGHDV
jgi:hypothetical protein